MLMLLFGYVVVLAFLFGGLCCITGETQKGNQILVNCLTAVMLYLLLSSLFYIDIPPDGVLSDGLPILNHIRQFKTIRTLLQCHPGIFASDFVEFATLVLIIQWIANIVVFPKAGFVGKVTSSMVITGIAVFVYGCFMHAVRDTAIMKWCVYCVECIITGGAILYPPVMLLSCITGLKKNNLALAYLVSVFPKTALGKAISSSVASAAVCVAFIFAIENQYGSAYTVLKQGVGFVKQSGGVFVLIIGIYFILNAIKSNKNCT